MVRGSVCGVAMLRCFATVRGRLTDSELEFSLERREIHETELTFSKLLQRQFLSKCASNALDPRPIDLRLSRNLDFTRTNFFRPFDRTGKV